MSFTKLYDDFFSQRYTGLAKFYNKYVKHNDALNIGDAGLGGLACRMIWALSFTSYEYTPTNLINGNQNTHEESDKQLFKDSMTKITRWITESNMFAHMEGLCCKVDMPNFSIIQQVDGTKGKVTVDNIEGIYQTVGGSPIWGDKDTIKLTFYETQIPLIENYIWPWVKACKYSYISNKDVYSIPRINMHVYLYPDDINTQTVFKYIVYGMYPVSFDAFQPSHEKKTSIDKRSVTFAYNNITVEQDHSFKMGISDYWKKTTVGHGDNRGYGDKRPGQIGSSLDNSVNKDDFNNRGNKTPISNKKINDKDKSELEQRINNIDLNGNPNDGLNANILPNTTDLLNDIELNGGDNKPNLNNYNNGKLNKNNSILNNTPNEIDTVSLLDPTLLSNSGEYLNNYNRTPKGGLSNNLNNQITNKDNSMSLDDALSQYYDNQKNDLGNSSNKDQQTKTDAADDIKNNNNNDKRISQLSNLLNQIQLNNKVSENNSQQTSNNSNSDSNSKESELKISNDNSIKNKTINDHANIKEIINSKSLARTYSVIKNTDDDQNNGWGKSGNQSSLNLDVVVDNKLKKQIQSVVSSRELNNKNNNNLNDINNRVIGVDNSSSIKINSLDKSSNNRIQQLLSAAIQNNESSSSNLLNQVQLNNKVSENNSQQTSNSNLNQITKTSQLQKNTKNHIQNVDLKEKIISKDKSMTLEEALKIYEQENTQELGDN